MSSSPTQTGVRGRGTAESIARENQDAAVWFSTWPPASPMTLQEVIVRYMHQEDIGSIRESTCRTVEEYLNRAARYHIANAARGWNDANEVSSVYYDELDLSDIDDPKGRHSIRARYPKGLSPVNFGSTMTISKPKTAIFPQSTIGEWYNEVSQDVMIPAELDQPIQRVRLEMIIQQLLRLILPPRHFPVTIGPPELWRGASTDGNSRFFVYLGCRLDGCALDTNYHIDLPDYLGDKINIPDGEYLPSQFTSELRAMSEMNKQCWYQQKEKVIQVARQIVNGQHKLRPMEEILRMHHIRPLQFLGRRIDPHIGSSSCRVATVIFGVTDSGGHEHRYQLEYAHRTRKGSTELSRLFEYDYQNHITEIQTHFLTSPPHRAHTFNSDLEETDMIMIVDLTETQKALIAALPSSPVFDSEPTAKLMSILANSSNLVAAKEASLIQTLKVANVTALIEHAILLTEFSRYGPSLYQDNHTLPVRRSFTGAIIDAAMESSELQLLPSAIVDLITDYATLDLPFIESEATEQMAAYPLVATHSNYPRHNSNPVEAIQRRGEIKILRWDSGRECITITSELPAAISSLVRQLSETEDEHPEMSILSEYIPPLSASDVPSESTNTAASSLNFFGVATVAEIGASTFPAGDGSSPFTFGGATFGVPPSSNASASSAASATTFGTAALQAGTGVVTGFCFGASVHQVNYPSPFGAVSQFDSLAGASADSSLSATLLSLGAPPSFGGFAPSAAESASFTVPTGSTEFLFGTNPVAAAAVNSSIMNNSASIHPQQSNAFGSSSSSSFNSLNLSSPAAGSENGAPAVNLQPSAPINFVIPQASDAATAATASSGSREDGSRNKVHRTK